MVLVPGGLSNTDMVPWLALMRPTIKDKMVDFPEPDEPSKEYLQLIVVERAKRAKPLSTLEQITPLPHYHKGVLHTMYILG